MLPEDANNPVLDSLSAGIFGRLVCCIVHGSATEIRSRIVSQIAKLNEYP
jgi:hypothetical protein